MNDTKSRRSGNVADRRVQFALVKRILSHWGIFVACACFVSLVTKGLTGGFEGTWGGFLSSYWHDVVPFLVVAVFLLPIFLVDTNKFSHKFAGPMIRFRRSMREVAAGQIVPAIKFRPGDFWHDIASDFNVMMERANSSIRNTYSKNQKETNEPVSSEAS